MAGINVNHLTSMLAKLQPDSALQNYALANKNDPYIVSLAASEANRRKELRSAAQAAQGMQPQPKVVDAAIAQMSPQEPAMMMAEGGLAALPAQNMQGMADGGIAGYEGYDEGGMTYGQEPVAMMADGGVARFNGSQSQFVQDLASIPAAYKKWWQQNREEDAEKAAKEQAMAQRRQEMLDARQKTSFANYLFGSPEREAEGQAELAELTKPTGSMPGPGYTRAGMKGDPRLNVPLTQPLQTESPPPAANKKPSAAPRPGAGAGPAAATLPSMSDLTALRQQIADKQNYQDPAASQLLELEAIERANTAAEKQAIERDAERFKDAYKGRESRLAEREADIGKQKESNTGLALLNAGLAIMSTPGGLATAIGKGAQVGTAQFAAGLDKIRSAQERLGEARDRLDDLKLNREESTAKEIRAAENNYRRVAVDAKKRSIDGVRMAADVSEKRASDIYSKTVGMAETVYKEEQANTRNAKAVAAANRTPEGIQTIERIMKEKNIPFSEALAYVTNAKREPVSMEKLRGDWLDMAKKVQIQADYPNIKTFEDYVAVFGGGAGGGGGGGGFRVVGVR